MSTPALRPGVAEIIRWRNAVFVVFFACGLVLASYMARVPHVRDLLGASTARMSVLTFAIAVGSVVGMTASSGLLERIGARRAIRVCGTLLSAGMLLAGVGVALTSFWLIAVGLVVFGLGYGTCDVAMNLSGAAQEKVAGRTIMPIYHALFSFGTMAGAALGAVAERLQIPVLLHLGVISVATAAAILAGNARLLPESLAGEDADDDTVAPGVSRWAVWAQPATILIGLVALGMALTEGSANDWLALAMVDGHDVSNTTGAVALGLFLTSMTAGRLLGVKALDRFGRVPVLRGSAVLAAVGLAVVILSPVAGPAFAGIVLWGLGASLGFPVAMSAAADDPRVAAVRVSAVATLGYLAFLAGPPVIGFLGELVGLLNALLVVLVAIGMAGICAGAAREPRRAGTR